MSDDKDDADTADALQTAQECTGELTKISETLARIDIKLDATHAELMESLQALEEKQQ